MNINVNLGPVTITTSDSIEEPSAVPIIPGGYLNALQKIADIFMTRDSSDESPKDDEFPVCEGDECSFSIHTLEELSQMVDDLLKKIRRNQDNLSPDLLLACAAFGEAWSKFSQ